MRIILSTLIAMAVMALLTMASAHAVLAAGASPWASNDQSRMRLIAAATAAGDDGGLMLGLHVELDRGWKIYWRSPGESGLPPQFDWSGSANVKDVKTMWPAPKRYTVFGFDTFAYSDEVVYPVRVRVADPSRPAIVALTLNYGLCHDICIPYSQKLSLHVPVGAAKPTVYKPLIERYAAKVPARVTGRQEALGLSIAAVTVDGVPGEETLVVALHTGNRLHKTDIIVEAPDNRATPFFFGRPSVSPEGGGPAVIARIPVTHGKKASIAGRPLVLTVLADGRAIEWSGTARPGG